MAPTWVAQDLGLFTKHGLQHSLNYLAATTAIQAIVGGTEEIGLVGNQGIDVALEGADTVYVANTAARFIFHLYGDPSIKSVADLKGKVLAATQAAASYGLRRPHGVAQVWLGAGQRRQDFIRRQRAGAFDHVEIRQRRRRPDERADHFSSPRVGPQAYSQRHRAQHSLCFRQRGHDAQSPPTKTGRRYALPARLHGGDLYHPARQRDDDEGHEQIHEDRQPPGARGAFTTSICRCFNASR